MIPDKSRLDRSWIEPRWAAISAVVIGIVIWGSLYPFAFYDRGTLAAGLRYLIMTWRFPSDRGDLISNILLYSPLGFFGARSLRRLGFPARVAVVTVFGATLSASMEFTQFWDIGRAPSVADLYSNAIGTLFGALVAGLHPQAWKFPLLGKMAWRPYALLLVVFWLGNRMFPFIPSLHLHTYAVVWNALPTPAAALDLYRQTVDWLAVALLLEALFGIDKSRIAVGLVAALTIAVRFLTGTAAPVEEFSAMLAVMLWIGVISRVRVRAVLVATLFTASVVLQALEPFQFESQPRRFGWIPFLGFIDGPRENGVLVFFDKAFTYGALVWLMVRAGFSWTVASVMCTILVLGLRMAQIYLPGRTAEITDATMLVMLAIIMKLMRDVPERY
jgi:VanZ family protein